ncbi:MAG: nickel-binding protein [Acidimicrobiia bacterium]
MPYFMDRHDNVEGTPDEVAEAHAQDLAVQEKYGVNYLSYWFDPADRAVFCFVEAPNQESAETVHREAHGLVANRIIPVEGQTVNAFLGRPPDHPAGEGSTASAFRTILFTDVVGSTDMTQRLGDAEAMTVLRVHDQIVRDAITHANGSEIKHTGDGIMAAFASSSAAIECAIAVQRNLANHNRDAEHPLHVRIGLSAGEPVTERDDLFGAAVQLAARACDRAAAGSILVSTAVRELARGKTFAFEARGPFALKGFDEEIPLFEVAWAESGPA